MQTESRAPESICQKQTAAQTQPPGGGGGKGHTRWVQQQTHLLSPIACENTSCIQILHPKVRSPLSLPSPPHQLRWAWLVPFRCGSGAANSILGYKDICCAVGNNCWKYNQASHRWFLIYSSFIPNGYLGFKNIHLSVRNRIAVGIGKHTSRIK